MLIEKKKTTNTRKNTAYIFLSFNSRIQPPNAWRRETNWRPSSSSFYIFSHTSSSVAKLPWNGDFTIERFFLNLNPIPFSLPSDHITNFTKRSCPTKPKICIANTTNIKAPSKNVWTKWHLIVNYNIEASMNRIPFDQTSIIFNRYHFWHVQLWFITSSQTFPLWHNPAFSRLH